MNASLWPPDPLLLNASVLWTERLLALALLLQTLELLQLRRSLSDDGPWSFSILRDDLRDLPGPLRWAMAVVLPYHAFLVLLVVRVLLSTLLLAGLSWSAVPLLLSQLAINARFRGTFNGGSDYMSVLILLALSLAACAPHSASVARACLGYVCVQLVFSYFVSGVAKLGRAEWRSGRALGGLFAANLYGVAQAWPELARRPWLLRLGSWATLGFECVFPCALFGPRWALPLLCAGALFHLANALLLGLNRFLFAWLAAYPALVYFSVTLARS